MKGIESIKINEYVEIYSDNPHIVDGDYTDIVDKVRNMGFIFDEKELLHYIHYGCGEIFLYLEDKVFTIWHGNTKKFTITRVK